MREITLAPYEQIVIHRIAYTAVLDGKSRWIIGKATEDMPGYSPAPSGTFPNEKAARKYAAAMNKEIGIDERDAVVVVLSTMRSGVRKGG